MALDPRPGTGALPDSLQDTQQQSALSLANLVQDTVEKETKELLKQIRDNNEHQIALLKASLTELWRDPGQTTHLRPNEGLVSIDVGSNNQEPHKADSNYSLRSLCADFGDETSTDRVAMLIILAVWGFRDIIAIGSDFLTADPGPIREAMARRQHGGPHPPGDFFGSMASLSDRIRAKALMDIKLKRGRTFVRMKQRDLNQPIANILVAHLMMQEWERTLSSHSVDWSRRYYWGLKCSATKDTQEYGLLSVIKAPSIGMGDMYMTLADMASVISHCAVTAPGGLEAYIVELAMCFLLSFTGPWKTIRNRSPSLDRCGWRLPLSPSEPLHRSTLDLEVLTMYHEIRVLSPGFGMPVNNGGIRLSRVVGSFAGAFAQQDDTKATSVMDMTEKRVSLWLTTSVSQPHPVFRGLVLSDTEAWCSAVANRKYDKHSRNKERDHGIRMCMWYGGIAVYQRTLVVILEVWYREWEELLLSLHKVLNVRLEDVFDAKKRASLMFETSSAYNFERSDRYFFVIELLRIATEWIKETGDDLKRLRAEVDDALLTSIEDKQLRKGEPHSSVPSWKACLDVTNHNWGIVFRAHTKYEKDLLDRIERKMQEAKSLRDGLFNATSVREATKGTNINEYILVFTVMTITYLPLGFVATLYGIDMFNFEIPGQTTSFAVTTVIVSLVTYLAAWGLLYGVRQRRKKDSFGDLISGLRGWARPATDMTKRVLKTRNSPKQAGQSSDEPEVVLHAHDELPPEDVEVDEEVGMNEGNLHEKPHSRWKVIHDWAISRRRRQEGDIGLGAA